MNLNDLEKVNELAARWRQLNALLQPASVGTSQLRVNVRGNLSEPYELAPEVTVKILQQLKSDVEKQLANYGVQPPTPSAREGRTA